MPAFHLAPFISALLTPVISYLLDLARREIAAFLFCPTCRCEAMRSPLVTLARVVVPLGLAFLLALVLAL